MRVEAHGVGSIMHVIKRGGRGMDIVRDNGDRDKFTRSLFYLNDEYNDHDWISAISKLQPPQIPDHWPEHRPLVDILAWTLMPNHFHILLQEIREGGIALFMQRLCGSMTKQHNYKYEETGSIFQGGYAGKTVGDDAYLQYVLSYIVVKNVFELYPGGLVSAVCSFDDAWRWALAYPYSSLRSHARREVSPILAMNTVQEIFEGGATFKHQARDMLFAHSEKRGLILPKKLQLEPW